MHTQTWAQGRYACAQQLTSGQVHTDLELQTVGQTGRQTDAARDHTLTGRVGCPVTCGPQSHISCTHRYDPRQAQGLVWSFLSHSWVSFKGPSRERPYQLHWLGVWGPSRLMGLGLTRLGGLGSWYRLKAGQGQRKVPGRERAGGWRPGPGCGQATGSCFPKPE